MECIESTPERALLFTGTPITGRLVIDAIIPGRWAAPPAPAIITFRPLLSAPVAKSIILWGVLCAERILISAECIGDAKWFIEKAQQYAKDRKVFNRPIGQNQGIQFPIARAYSKMCAAELMLREAINLFDQGENPGKESNLAKLLCSEASWEAAETCMQTFGGFGFAEEYEVERKYREARLYQVAPISTNLILSFIAEHVLKLPRSY